MAKIDLSKTALAKTNGARRTRTVKVPEPGGFEDRVSGRTRKLAKLIREGVPEIEYLRESEGMLVKSGKHVIAAPQKSGKSLATLAHVTRIVRAGGKVIVLDRENGAHEYARRLGGIFDAWDLKDRDRRAVDRGLVYVEFPKLQVDDRDRFGGWVKKQGAELVVFDAQRLFLTDLGFAEDDADDYSRFIVAAIEPVTEAGTATLILDNTGHGEVTRARGSSSKGDLNEVLFVLETSQPFSRERKGRLLLKLEPGRSRFGNEGEWSMAIGGGEFGPWKPAAKPGEKIKAPSAENPARKLVLGYVAENPGSRLSGVVRGLKGKGAGTAKLETAGRELLAERALIKDEEGGLHVPQD